MRVFRRSDKPDSLQGRRIGVLGLGRGVGTTHIAITFANYLSDKRHMKVCLIENSGRQDISCFLQREFEISKEEAEGYEYDRVFYSSKQIFGRNFDCTVFDLGSMGVKQAKQLEFCDIIVIAGAAAPWRANEYKLLKTAWEEYGDSVFEWILLINLCSIKRLGLYKDYRMKTGAFPIETDPIYPGAETIKLFEKMFA